MKKRIVLFSVFYLAALLSFAQDEQANLPYSFRHQNISMNIDNVTMPAIDRDALLKEDEANSDKSTPYRVGVGFSLGTTTKNAGRLDETADSGKLWRIQYRSENAYMVYLVFDHFNIPENAELYVYSPDHEQVYGPYTNKDVQSTGRFESDNIIGDELIVEYYEPANARYEGEFEIAAFMHIYKNILHTQDDSKGPYGDAEGNCHLDVACPEVQPWRDNVRSVVFILMSARVVDENTHQEGWMTALCSGAMINNVRMDKTPYVLSANHCVSDVNQTYKFYFNYQTNECGGTSGTSKRFANGGKIIARSNESANPYTASDFLLLKITGYISPTYSDSIVFAGWDRSGAASVGVGIHHPHGDWKKASFPSRVVNVTNGSYANKFFVVSWMNNPNKGVTEQGSSGSPLFNARHRIIGTLTGGSSYCYYVNGTDDYGKFSYHWLNNGATLDENKLQPWLDPDNTGAIVLDGMTYSGEVIVGIDEPTVTHTFTIAPNPANSGIVTIQGEFMNELATCRIYNAMGQLVKVQDVTTDATFTMNVNDLRNGIYFIDITGSERNYKSKLIIAK